jgi:hypothetical protein
MNITLVPVLYRQREIEKSAEVIHEMTPVMHSEAPCVCLKIHVSVTSFMFAFQFLKIDIPRAVPCYRTTEDTPSLLACLLWLLISFLLLMYSGTKIHNSRMSAFHFIPILLPLIYS